MKIVLIITSLMLAINITQASNRPWVTTEYPQDVEKWWWDDAWWNDGKLPVPSNYDVVMEKITYMNGDTEVPAFLFKPKNPGQYLPVLFQHGRRGLDDLTLGLPRRLAARGFIVLAPDVWSARFIEKYPLAHDYDVEGDTARGIEVLLQQNNIRGKKACIVSHTRGGYIALKALVTHGKQEKDIACYVSYYPHWQDPNEPEPMQVYRYATEINELKVPTLVFVGEHEQYQRLRPIVEGVKTLKEKGRDARLLVYPGVGRGFDFRPSHVRTFADDLAAKDAAQRTEDFIRRHLD